MPVLSYPVRSWDAHLEEFAGRTLSLEDLKNLCSFFDQAYQSKLTCRGKLANIPMNITLHDTQLTPSAVSSLQIWKCVCYGKPRRKGQQTQLSLSYTSMNRVQHQSKCILQPALRVNKEHTNRGTHGVPFQVYAPDAHQAAQMLPNLVAVPAALC